MCVSSQRNQKKKKKHVKKKKNCDGWENKTLVRKYFCFALPVGLECKCLLRKIRHLHSAD